MRHHRLHPRYASLIYLLALAASACSREGAGVVEGPPVLAASYEFAILEFTVNGAGGNSFRISSKDSLVVSADVYDKHDRVDKKQPQVGQDALLAVQVRDESTSKPVTQTNLMPKLPYELKDKKEQPGVHRLKAELGGIPAGEYTLAIVLMERRKSETDSEFSMQYSLQDILRVPLTVTKEGEE